MTKRSENGKKTFIAFILAILASMTLVVTTVAWMTMSAAPVVSDLSLYLVSDNNNALQIAPDANGKPGEYGPFVDLSDIAGDATVLKPVTFSAGKYAFLIPVYGWDGRIADTTPVYLTNPLDDSDYSPEISLAADDEVLGGYLYQFTFWMKAQTTGCYVSLSDVTKDGKKGGEGCYLIGKPKFDAQTGKHESAGKNAEYATRVGFLVYGTEYDPESRFLIWEPNADGGKAEQISDGSFFTESLDGEDFNLATASSKVNLVQQLTTKWEDYNPSHEGAVKQETAEFTTDSLSLMRLRNGEERKVTLFLWLEGQDLDCENAIHGAELILNVQFKGIVDNSDMPIKPE